MSVLIKGMIKPKDCSHCDFCSEEDIFFETPYRCEVTRNWINEDFDFTKDCPLVEVPDHHGRLIDADALVAESLADGAYGYVDTKEIYDAPTIVEAE